MSALPKPNPNPSFAKDALPRSFPIHASAHQYHVTIAPAIAAETLAALPDALVLCDARLLDALPVPRERCIAFEATEDAKDLAHLSSLLVALKERGANRHSTLYAVGGGVVQDAACFIASIYMRGMRWVYLPTTLLGMCDSCIGGKSSINAGGYKNLVGTFHPPEAVLLDPLFARTLATEQRIAGLAEAVKICYAHTGDFFARYLALTPGPEADEETLSDIIALSLACKKWFIEIDEFDRNERQLLNFGHTFGHAIEAAGHYAISHGVAVGVGMLCALAYAKEAVGATQEGSARLLALETHVKALLAHLPELNALLAALDARAATEKFTADKKHDAEQYWIIAPNAAGYLERVALPKNAASRERITALFARAKEGYERL